MQEFACQDSPFLSMPMPGYALMNERDSSGVIAGASITRAPTVSAPTEASHAVEGVIDLSAPVSQAGSVTAALTIPYVKTPRSRSVPYTVGPLVQVADAISRQPAGARCAID